MKVTIFGIYSLGPEYPRQNNLKTGMESTGTQVTECHYSIAGNFSERLRSVTTFSGALSFGMGLLRSYLVLIWRYLCNRAQADAIVILYPGLLHVHLAKFLSLTRKNRPLIVYDFFFSIHDTLVRDRALLKEASAAARLIRWWEWKTLLVSDLVLVDTRTHGEILAESFGIPIHKFHPVPVGSTIGSTVSKLGRNTDKIVFKVIFIGTYIPLHGIDIILKAASILRGESDIHFTLIGGGQLKDAMLRLANDLDLTNVVFRDWAPHGKLGETLHYSDLCLGIFGTSVKAKSVIPIKVYDICAAGKPFITADTPAIREMFKHRQNAYLVPPGEERVLARGILELKNDSELRMSLAKQAADTGRRFQSQRASGEELIRAIGETADSLQYR